MCHRPWTAIYIDVKGDVYPCTDNLNYKLGNIYEKNLKEIYNSKRMKEFREKSMKGQIENCVKCNGWAPGKCPLFKRYILKKMRTV